MVDQSHSRINRLVEELLSDPVTSLAMEADGIERAAFRRQLCRTSLQTYPPAGDRGGTRSRPTGYRPGVGIALFDHRGRVLLGHRLDAAEHPWQMPQGGVDSGESPREAALRELQEELGIKEVEILQEMECRLRYDLPPDLIGRSWGGYWRGQTQSWFAIRFLGTDKDINVATDHPEFSEWRWADLHEVANVVVPFKREVYLIVTEAFSAFAGSAANDGLS